MLPFRSLAALAAVAFLGALPSLAHGQLNIVCSASTELCRQLADEFQKDIGIKAMLVDTGGRSALAVIAEEKGRPQSDLWLGGPAETYYRAVRLGLVDAYSPAAVKELQPWAQKVHEQSKSQSVGVYAQVVGIGYNSALATQKKLAAPSCWKDLAKPGYAGEVHIADPKSSAATYFAIAGMSQIFGEDQAFKYLKTMYQLPVKKRGRADAIAETQKGATPKGLPSMGTGKGIAGNVPLGGSRSGTGRGGKAGASGASGGGVPVVGGAIAGVGFIGDVVTEAEGGAPVKAVAPCEGTIQEVGAVSIINGARNLDNAKKFVDWVLGAKAQALIVKQSRAYPANPAVASPPLAPKWSEIKFIDYDAATYEKTAARRRLVERWTQEIATSAQ